MERGFMMALDDLFKWKTRHALHDRGLIDVHGRNYEVQDGDVIEFLFNV